MANVDQALVIFAAAQPQPNFSLLDRFLVMMERQEIPVKICFNKKDLVSEEECQSVCQLYSDCGYDVVWTSALLQDGREEIRQLLRGKTTVVAGPSGVGKSSLTNLVQSEVQMETGEISQKLKRGKRHHQAFGDHSGGTRHLSGGHAGIQFAIFGEYRERRAEKLFYRVS